MVRITFIEHDGERTVVEADPGLSLMQAATDHGVRGVIAECGGARVCGTCHCYIDPPWSDAAGTPGEDEQLLLTYSEHHRGESRLSCQIRVTEALDGLVVRLPPSQP